MTVTSVVAPLVRGKIARLTLVDQCGVPQAANSVYTTDGFIIVSSTKNMDMGDEIKVRQANGIIGVHEPGRVSLLNYTLDVQFLKVDPGALAMLTGDPAILDYASKIVGFSERAMQPVTQNFALEVWTDTSATACTAGSKSYGYMLYPLVSEAYVTFDSITDKEVTASIHALSYGSPGWGRGPFGTGTAPGRTVADGVLNATTTVTSATAAFTSADVGKTITGGTIPAGAIIASVTNGTTVIISAAAIGSASGVSLVIGAGDGSSISGPVAISANTPGRLLVPADLNEHRHFEITTIAPPAAQSVAGPQSITLPSPY